MTAPRNSQATPGPWTSVERPGTNGAVTVATIIRPCYGRIAEVYNRADAALIALAPELLAFVEKCERAGAMASRGEDAIDLVRLIEMDARALLASVRS